MTLNTDHLQRGIGTLEASLGFHRQAAAGSIDQDVFRNAIVKGDELTQETSFKLFKRARRDCGRGGRKLERWFAYRDNRNDAAHDHGEGFARETLALLPGFIADAKSLEAKRRGRFAAAG